MKKLKAVVLTTAFSLLGFQLGCGGGSGATSCGKVYPCGGAIAGTWKIVDSCTTSPEVDPPDFCPTATSSVKDLKVSGTVTYTATNTYNAMATISGTLETVFPADCLMTLGMTCTQFQAAQQQVIAQDPDSPVQSITCVTRGTSCACSAKSSQDTTESGTYQISGNTLTQTAAGGAPEENDYCVQGSTLHLVNVDMTMPVGSMGQFKITDDIVLTKQ